jgi:carboxypeptidase family protein/TonB-dependent receptor-like protein
MRALQFTFATIVCVLASAGAADAQAPTIRQMVGMGAIDGVVTDTMLVPLTSATVSILGSTVRVVTGDNGRFRIAALQPGQYIVIAHRLGYEPLSARVNVTVTDTERVSFALERIATALDTVKVAGAQLPARFDDFERRLKNREATAAFTREDILKVNPVDTWQMLTRVPGVKLIPHGKTGGLWAVSNRAMKIDGGSLQAVPCFMTVMIDGVPMGGDSGGGGAKSLTRQSGDASSQGGQFDMGSLPPPDQIHGIEVFAGPASIPPQYNGAANDKMCGLIAIWTR